MAYRPLLVFLHSVLCPSTTLKAKTDFILNDPTKITKPLGDSSHLSAETLAVGLQTSCVDFAQVEELSLGFSRAAQPILPCATVSPPVCPQRLSSWLCSFSRPCPRCPLTGSSACTWGFLQPPTQARPAGPCVQTSLHSSQVGPGREAVGLTVTTGCRLTRRMQRARVSLGTTTHGVWGWRGLEAAPGTRGQTHTQAPKRLRP